MIGVVVVMVMEDIDGQWSIFYLLLLMAVSVNWILDLDCIRSGWNLMNIAERIICGGERLTSSATTSTMT